MRTVAAAALLLLALAGNGAASGPPVVRPFEADPGTVAAKPLDAFVLAAQRKAGVEPANPCSDAVFLRRVHLDLIGTLPTPEETSAFLADERANRRALLVDALFERPEFADLWTLKWCDLLRVKSEFPVNLWPNAVQAYHRWVHEQVRTNAPYDRFVRDLLTSSGSNFRVPPANFWRAMQGRRPRDRAAAVALTFLGERIERWPEERREGFAALFSRVSTKATREWKEEIVFHDPTPTGPLDAMLPDGTEVRVGAEEDPRRVFADWLLARGNPYCARTVVNRIWSWLLGRGVVHEADDFRADNPASIPGLLPYLERELVNAKWDLRHVFRLIVLSRTYQQSPVARGDPDRCAALFACYPVRRLGAEVLLDALRWVGGRGEGYTSIVPEPFTFVPDDLRTTQLADGSISNPFLDAFGRPSRDTGLESERSRETTPAQRLHLLNSTDVHRTVRESPRIRAVVDAAGNRPADAVRGLYVLLLSRPPEDDELAAAEAYVRGSGRPVRDAAVDVAWALLNTREFLFHH